MQPTRLPRKKDVVLQLLEQATVFVHLDPRAEAVRVPPWFKRQPQLVLQVGLNMAVPIPDLEVNDEGLSCTLSFNRAPFLCVIPWSAVFALVDENRQGMVWPDDVPPEIAAQAQQAKPAPARAELKIAPPPAAEAAPAKKAKRARKTATKVPARAASAAGAEAKPARARAAAKPRATAAKTTATKPKRGVAPTAVAAAQKAPLQRAEPAAAPAPAAAAGDGKRKLPPYLRVVK
jgi:stringent starvation protein B